MNNQSNGYEISRYVRGKTIFMFNSILLTNELIIHFTDGTYVTIKAAEGSLEYFLGDSKYND